MLMTQFHERYILFLIKADLGA